MRTNPSLATIIATTTCLVVFVTPAAAQVKTFQIQAGDLSSAISTYIRQSGVQVVYRADEMGGTRFAGLSGTMSVEVALSALLANSGFKAKRDVSGAFAIIKANPQVVKGTAVSFVDVQDSAPVRVPERIAPESTGSEDIIVTARKREESLIAVPVTITAVSGANLERRGIVSLDNLTQIVPQLQLGHNGANSQGGNIGIRGIAGSDGNPFADQAVSFNIDGVQISRANIRRMASMDIGQVEVLKGPQALFFGKNSPGGVISIRSADPTSTFQAKASVGHEFNAREWRGDGFLSGPLSDTLGARLAVQGSTMRGWFRNEVDNSNIYRSGNEHGPKTKDWAARGTLKWEPDEKFNARLKLTYGELDDNGIMNTAERLYCPQRVPQAGGGPDNCKLDGRGARLDLGPFLGTLAPQFKDGAPYIDMKQLIMSNEMNYQFSDQLALTSVTGYYDLSQNIVDNLNLSWDSAQVLASAFSMQNKEFSQELRLASNYDSWANFVVGAYFQKSSMASGIQAFLGLEPKAGVNPLQLVNFHLRQRALAYSWFGQALIKPVEQVEIAAGGRYSYERKRLVDIESQNGLGVAPRPRVPVPPNSFPRKDSWTDFSPEFTISYRPSGDLTIYASHKRGFLSGGFNAGATDFFTSDLRYDQQVIKGFEGGAKASLLDGALRTNFAAYRYVVTGLQVSTSQVLPTGALVNLVLNAGKATVKGVEFDFNYDTPLDGLSLHGAVGYNDAKYDIFTAACYQGQTQEAGCNVGMPTVAVIGGQAYTTYSSQNLTGSALLRAPKWSGSVGASFVRNIGDKLRFGLNGDLGFSSSYNGNLATAPVSVQKAWQTIDAGARIGAQDDSWELALIARNLTDKHYALRINDLATNGFGVGRAASDPRGSLLSDQAGSVNRGREIMLRATIRYGQ